MHSHVTSQGIWNKHFNEIINMQYIAVLPIDKDVT